MRFRPKVFNSQNDPANGGGPDELTSVSPEELSELPAELEVLAEQLKRESCELASLFPADLGQGDGPRGPVEGTPSASEVGNVAAKQRSWASTLGGTLAAIALTGLVAVAVLPFAGWWDEPLSSTARMQTGGSEVVESSLPVESPEVQTGQIRLVSNLTGPELEGMLDILEADEQSEVQVSF